MCRHVAAATSLPRLYHRSYMATPSHIWLTQERSKKNLIRVHGFNPSHRIHVHGLTSEAALHSTVLVAINRILNAPKSMFIHFTTAAFKEPEENITPYASKRNISIAIGDPIAKHRHKP